jgi:hypothetical protein
MEGHLCLLGLRISLLAYLSCRMLQLGLSWLGLGPGAAFPWQLLQLVGASLFLARILTWICAFYDNYCRLRCFPEPPSRHWFWGHMSMVSVAAGRSGVSGKALRNLGVVRGWRGEGGRLSESLSSHIPGISTPGLCLHHVLRLFSFLPFLVPS